MSEAPRAQGGEGPTAAGAKPSIAEVAAWLRRAAEQRDAVEDLTPAARRSDSDAPAPAESSGEQHGPPAPDRPQASALLDDGADTVNDDGPAAEVEAPDQAPPPVDDASVERADPAEQPPALDRQAPDEPAPAEVVAPQDERTIGADGHDDPPPGGEGGDDEPAAAEPTAGTATGNGLRPFVIGGSPAGPAEMHIETSPGVDDVEEEDLPAPPADTTIAVPNGAAARTPPALDETAEVDQVDPDGDAGAVARVDEVEGDEIEEVRVDDDEVIDLTDGSRRTDGPGEAQRDGEEVPKVEALVQDDPEKGLDAVASGAPEQGDDDGATDPAAKVSLFDLDLAELAARARAASERVARAEPAERDPWAEREERRERAEAVEEVEASPRAATTAGVDELAVVEEEPAGLHLPWSDQDDQGDQGVVAGDVRLDDEGRPEIAPRPARATPTTATAMAMVNAALQKRRDKRQRYPRGQLTERIGVLARVRAMLGIVVLTVVLGVAAGAAIGAFLVFAAFALRNAITSG